MTVAERIVEYMRGRASVTPSELRRALRLGSSTARRDLGRLAASGHVLRVRYGHYVLAAKPPELQVGPRKTDRGLALQSAWGMRRPPRRKEAAA